jgi:fructokinase
VSYLNPFSSDQFGQGLAQRLQQDGVHLLGGTTQLPTSLAVVQLNQGQPSYGFYREGIADRDYTVEGIVALLQQHPPGILHSGSLLLIPPEHGKVVAILKTARELGWTVSVDINLRPKVAGHLPYYIQAVHEVITLADWLKASDEDLQTLGFKGVAIGESPRLVRELRQSRVASGSDSGTVAGSFHNTLSRVALTFGGEGAYLDIDGQSHSLPVPHITVADTVGAGDTFWGNTLADWALQPDVEAARARIAQTLAFAMKAAAINCTRQGCQPPDRAEVENFKLGGLSTPPK